MKLMTPINRNNAGRMAGVILVGQSNGMRRIRWGAAFLLGCALGAFGAAIAVIVYYALSGTFSPLALIIGFGGPFITVGSGIRRAWRLPGEQLTSFDV